MALFPVSSYCASVTIGYTSTITPDSSSPSGDYPGLVNSFYLPYTASNGSQSLSSSPITFNLGSFQTDTWTSPNPTVTSTFTVTITPTVNNGPALADRKSVV